MRRYSLYSVLHHRSRWDSRRRSAPSLDNMTFSQKSRKVDHASSCLTACIRMQSRSRVWFGLRIRQRRSRSSVHAGHLISVWSASSASSMVQWWHLFVVSFPIRCRYDPKHPCPVSTCVILKVTDQSGGRFIHSSKTGNLT